jgi:protein involved in polysaccharide export with SLBB domain
MTPRLLLFLLFTSTLCRCQSVLTTPGDLAPSGSRPSTARPANAGQAPGYPARQPGEREVEEAPARGTNEPRVPAAPVTRIAGPLRERSEFERFAEEATASRLPVYGRRLFDEVPTTFAPLEHVPVPSGYVIGPGDQLLIRAWGKIDLDSQVTVDRNGQIDLPRVGALHIAGLRYDQLQGYLHAAVSALFKDFELNVSLGELRSIQIFVLGNARQPGSYTVGSLSTLVNALFASGGPSATGSMRRIQLRRGDLVVSEFDIYDLAQRGDKSRDVPLLPGDVLYIPPIGAQVAIAGNVEEPGIYELKGKATVGAAIEGAGGLTSLAGTGRVVLERIENHMSRRVEEFPLDANGLEKPLQDGDLLRIFPLPAKFENAVTLRGNAAEPGRYVWKQGMRIADLIPSRDALLTRTYWNGQNQLVPGDAHDPFENPREPRFTGRLDRQSADEPGQEDGFPRTWMQADRPASQSEGREPDQFERQTEDQLGGSPTGPQGNPRTDERRAPRASMIEAIGQNSAEINWEYAVIERLDDRDLSTRLIPFRLANAIDDHSSVDNQLLNPGDVVTVFARSDLELPMEKRASFVRLGGEIGAPGVYRVEPGETLRALVQRAGGLTSRSYLYASLLTRVSTRRAQQEQLRVSAEQMQRELTSRYANAAPQNGQSGADQQAQFAIQQAALARLTAVRPTGRVVLEMKPDAATAADIPDFPLEDGDAFYIPPRLSTIEVAGAVYNANAFRHEPGKRLNAYLNDAGGATREADTKRTFVIRADGTVVSRQSRGHQIHGGFEALRLLPGDAIVVPEKLRVASKLNDLLQATQFASQTALTAAALSVIK